MGKMTRNRLLMLLIFLLSMFLTCLITDYDYDLFARLEVGEIFFKTGKILTHCPFSYTETHKWFDHEWGSGVVFYGFLKTLGAGGLILLNSLLFFGTTYFILKTRKTISLIPVALFLVMIHHTNGALIRCQAFSFFFLAVFIFLLEKYREDKTKWIWILPALTVIWNNLHGGVVSGLGIAFIYALGLTFERKPAKELWGSLLTSIAVLVINPYGIKYIAFLFFAATMRRDFIFEWYDVFQAYHFAYFLPVLVVMALILGYKIYSDIKNKSFDLIQYVVLALALYMGLAHIKMLGISLVVLFMYCALPVVLEKLERILAVVIIVLACSIPLYSINVPRATFSTFPLKEVEYLKINKIKGNILVPFEMGSYVSYKLYPENLIYMDGRYEEVYYQKTLDDLLDFCNKRDGWRKALDDYPTEIVMVEKFDPAYAALNKEKDWEHLYTGSLCGVFVKKNANIFHHDLAPVEDIDYYRENMFKHTGSFIKND